MKASPDITPADRVGALRAWTSVHGLATLAIDGMLPLYDPVMLARTLVLLAEPAARPR